ncbi:MAG: UDP-3-O-(3-hydroxymyristoyl)glucosamine N-acyltransferase [Alphaproteobacteria bacterium]|nr:UDP-3-O-(3-hydroxymyristoyl)glucosamine N-acyltransferase [Alphaproteobacteria bacterium]
MADPRFFDRRGPLTVAELAALTGAAIGDGGDPGRRLGDVAPLDLAGPDDLSFIDNPKYLPAFAATRAGACFVAPKNADRAPAGTALLISRQPYKAYALAAQAFYPLPDAPAGVHPTAVVAPTARIGDGVSLAPHVVVEDGAELGAGTSVGAGSVIGRNVVVGEGCRIGAQVVLSHCLIGAGTVLHAGVKIGQDGFGFAPDPAGHVKVPQLGRVLIGRRCEIGANSTIDRGAGPDTVVGDGCWIDNLVQIGHNVTLGRGCILVAQSGVAGSSHLGDFVAIGAQGGVAGHLTLGTGAQVAAQGGVMTDIGPGETYSGSPAMPIKQHFRQVATIKRLAQKKGRDE